VPQRLAGAESGYVVLDFGAAVLQEFLQRAVRDDHGVRLGASRSRSSSDTTLTGSPWRIWSIIADLGPVERVPGLVVPVLAVEVLRSLLPRPDVVVSLSSARPHPAGILGVHGAPATDLDARLLRLPAPLAVLERREGRGVVPGRDHAGIIGLSQRFP